MANGISDSINQGLTRLSQSPLGMASMGLLMMPQKSLEPINPMQYAMQGMQAGIQNQQRAQMMERQQQEEARRQAEFYYLAREYSDKFLKARQEEAQQQAMLDSISQYSMGLDPVKRLAFNALPLSEKAKIISAQYFPATQEPTTTVRNLAAAGLTPGTPEFQQAMMTYLTRPRVQVNTGDKPVSISDLQKLEPPEGAPLTPGVTLSGLPQGTKVRQPEPKPPTEAQSVSAGFYERMKRAHQDFSPALEQEIIKPTQAMLSGAPLLGNYLVSPAYQVASNIQRDFVTANLRKESGAVIADEEMENEIKKYFPQPGDKPAVIERKRRLRETAIQAMRANAGKVIQQSGSSMTTPAGMPVTTDMQSGRVMDFNELPE